MIVKVNQQNLIQPQLPHGNEKTVLIMIHIKIADLSLKILILEIIVIYTISSNTNITSLSQYWLNNISNFHTYDEDSNFVLNEFDTTTSNNYGSFTIDDWYAIADTNLNEKYQSCDIKHSLSNNKNTQILSDISIKLDLL